MAGACAHGEWRLNASDDAGAARSRLLRVALAFAIVYVVWGSTYLAIRIGVQGIPPATFAGSRFVAAGGLLLIIAALRGARWPASLMEWGRLSLTGVILLGAANGLVTWASQWVASNLAALVVASSALWLALIGAIGPTGDKVSAGRMFGLLTGFAGVALLLGTRPPEADVPPLAYVGLLLAPLFWAGGSIFARRHPAGCSPLVAIGIQMLAAGLVLSLIALIFERNIAFEVDMRAWLAWLYLLVFGSCIGYAAYIWLVHEVTPSSLGTFAYVNPMVAAVLGWWLLDERLSGSQIIGAMIILLGVILVSASARRRAPSAEGDKPTE
jgi:drug/metabolite transporter (DMT)-like permease